MRGGFAIGGKKILKGLVLCQIEPALAGHQQLAPDGGLCLRHRHGEPRIRHFLGRHQTGRPRADHQGLTHPAGFSAAFLSSTTRCG